MRKPLPFFILVLAGIGFDLLTKKLAFDALPLESTTYVIVPHVLDFVRRENTGVAFSLFSGYPWAILAVTSAAIAFFVWLYLRMRKTVHALSLVATNLLLIGAIGNLIDRVWLNYVRDFIDFTPRMPLVGHWAVFNVADVFITVGVILLVITEFFLTPTPKKDADMDTGKATESRSGG